MEQLLEVLSIEPRKDKNGADFKIVTFKGVKLFGNRQVNTNVQGTRIMYSTHTAMKDGKEITIKGDVDFDTITRGAFFEGSIESFDTTPYQIDGRTVESYKCVVFGNEKGLAVAARNLDQYGAKVYIDREAGQVYVPATAPARATAAKATEDLPA